MPSWDGRLLFSHSYLHPKPSGLRTWSCRGGWRPACPPAARGRSGCYNAHWPTFSVISVSSSTAASFIRHVGDVWQCFEAFHCYVWLPLYLYQSCGDKVSLSLNNLLGKKRERQHPLWLINNQRKDVVVITRINNIANASHFWRFESFFYTLPDQYCWRTSDNDNAPL